MGTRLDGWMREVTRGEPATRRNAPPRGPWHQVEVLRGLGSRFDLDTDVRHRAAVPTSRPATAPHSLLAASRIQLSTLRLIVFQSISQHIRGIRVRSASSK